MRLYILRIVIVCVNKTLIVSYLLFAGIYNNCLLNTIDINTQLNNMFPHAQGIKSHKFISCFLNELSYCILFARIIYKYYVGRKHILFAIKSVEIETRVRFRV